MIFKFLSYIDLFQIPIKFYFSGRTKLFSNAGVFFSLLIYGLLIYSFAKSDFILKEQPIVVSQSIQTNHAEKIEFGSDSILSFGIVDYLGNRYWDQTYFTVYVRYFYNVTNYETKELVICTDEFHTTKIIGFNISNQLCLKNKTFSIEGSLDDLAVSYAAITVAPCDNKTMNNTCKSFQEINDYMDTYPIMKYFAVRLRNDRIDGSNYENPFQFNTDIPFQYMDSKVQRTWNIYLKNAFVETDDGWFAPSKSTKQTVMIDKRDSDFRLRKDSDAFFKVILLASKERLTYTRRYKKLPEALAELAGILKLGQGLFSIITRLVIYIGTLHQVLNKLYIFPKLKKPKRRGKRNFSNKQDPQKALPPLKALEISQPIAMSKPLTQLPFIEKLPEPEQNGMKDYEEFNKADKGVVESKNYHINPKELKDDSYVLEHFSQEGDINNINIKPIDPSNVNPILPLSVSLPPKNPPNTQIIIESKGKNKPTMSKRISSMFLSLKSFARKEKQGWELGFFDYLWYIWCRIISSISKKKLSPKHRVIEAAEKAYINDMDSLGLLKKLHDLDKLKMLLLDEDQLALFNFISKPVVTPFNDNEVEMDEIHESNRHMTNLIKKQTQTGKELEEIYKRVIENKESSSVNSRLIRLMNLEISKLKKNQ